MNKSMHIVVSCLISCCTAQSMALAQYNDDSDSDLLAANRLTADRLTAISLTDDPLPKPGVRQAVMRNETPSGKADTNEKYVKAILKLAQSGTRKDYEKRGNNADREVANVWQLVSREDLAALIENVDKKALVDFQKNNLAAASDRLYCGLDCAAMLGRSLGWGDGHLEGVELNQAKPLVWLDSFADMNVEVDSYPSDKTFRFRPYQYIAAVNNYAYYMQLQGKHAEVIPIFQKIIELDPGRTVAYLNLADSLWAVGDKTQASQRYSQYLSHCQKLHFDAVPERVQERFIATAAR